MPAPPWGAAYSACSGSILLAEAGLPDHLNATSHWAYEGMFRTCHPRAIPMSGFAPNPILWSPTAPEAKRLLETGTKPAEEMSAEVGYEESAFFRRLFKRLTGVTPGQYRRMFQPIFTETSI